VGTTAREIRNKASADLLIKYLTIVFHILTILLRFVQTTGFAERVFFKVGKADW